MNKMIFRKAVSVLLLLVIILFFVSGYAMTNSKFLDLVDFGVFRRRDFFSLHSGMVIPLVILLIIHIYPYLKIKK